MDDDHIIDDLDHLCDAQVVTKDGQVFSVHRILMAIRSDYFHRLLCVEGLEDRNIVVPQVNGAIMSIVLDYIKSQELRTLVESDLPDLISAASFLSIEDLLQSCRSSALRNLTTSNCVPLFLTAVQINDWDFAKACVRFAVVHFERILQDPSSRFQDMSLELLEKLLSLDSLNASSEQVVWSAVDLWISKDPQRRKMHVAELLSYVRFPAVETGLATTVLNHAHVRDSPHFSHIKDMICRSSLSSKHRIPKGVFFITKSFVNFSDYTEGVKAFLTYDEDVDFWRNVGCKADFTPNFVLPLAGPLIVMFDTMNNVSFTFNVISKTWIPLDPPEVSRTEFMVVKVGRFVYALGGLIPEEGFIVSTAVERYDPDSGEWVPTLPHYPVRQGAAAVLDNIIYVVGTVTSGRFCEIIVAQSFNPETESWTELSPPNTYRRLFALVVYKSQLYTIGGHSSDGFLKSVEVYDVGKNVWNDFESLPFSYFFPKAVVVKDVLYVYDNHSNELQDFRFPPVRWDEITRQWQVVEASSPFCDLHLYEFCAIDDEETIVGMRNENADPLTKWKASPFLRCL